MPRAPLPSSPPPTINVASTTHLVNAVSPQCARLRKQGALALVHILEGLPATRYKGGAHSAPPTTSDARLLRNAALASQVKPQTRLRRTLKPLPTTLSAHNHRKRAYPPRSKGARSTTDDVRLPWRSSVSATNKLGPCVLQSQRYTIRTQARRTGWQRWPALRHWCASVCGARTHGHGELTRRELTRAAQARRYARWETVSGAPSMTPHVQQHLGRRDALVTGRPRLACGPHDMDTRLRMYVDASQVCRSRSSGAVGLYVTH